MQNWAISGPICTIPRASTRAARAFEAADITCEQAAKDGTQIGACSKEHGACEVRCAKEISAMVRPNELVQKLTLVGGKERADAAPEARAEQHEKRATKTEQLVRRTTMRRPAGRATQI